MSGRSPNPLTCIALRGNVYWCDEHESEWPSGMVRCLIGREAPRKTPAVPDREAGEDLAADCDEVTT